MGGALFPPKHDCPHAALVNAAKILKVLLPKKGDDPDLLLKRDKPCCTCCRRHQATTQQQQNSDTDNDASPPAMPGPARKPWLCMTCGEIHCLEEDHMDQHSETLQHPISLNIADKMFWCVECKSYVIHPELIEIKRVLYKGPPPFTRQELIEGLKSKTYQRITVLTGAGISVAAGIPDFRTPGTGLYSRLSDLGLPFAEAVFQLDFFRSNPFPFYEVARSFLVAPEDLEEKEEEKEEDEEGNECGQVKKPSHIQPVFAHHFIKLLSDREQLLLNFTQNIDGLELLANVPEDKLIQAHGHMRTAHCIDCQQEYSMTSFLKHLKKQRHLEYRQEMFLCQPCVSKAQQHREMEEAKALESTADLSSPSTTEKVKEYKGLIKPDIVFFGESLPESFKQRKDEIEQSDLVIVMGTSLQVFPFASLITMAPPHVPVVMINRENPGVDRERFLFLGGDIQEILKELVDEMNGVDLKKKDVSPANRPQSSKKVLVTSAATNGNAKGKASTNISTNKVVASSGRASNVTKK